MLHMKLTFETRAAQLFFWNPKATPGTRPRPRPRFGPRPKPRPRPRPGPRQRARSRPRPIVCVLCVYVLACLFARFCLCSCSCVRLASEDLTSWHPKHKQKHQWDHCIRPPLAAIPRRMLGISSELLRSSAVQGPVSTGVGDRPERPRLSASLVCRKSAN